MKLALPIISNILLLFCYMNSSVAQNNTGIIKGKVEDSLTNPVYNASVHLEGIKSGTITDKEGKFVLKNIPAGSYTITIACIGYKTVIQKLTIKPGEVFEIKFTTSANILSLPVIQITGLKSKNGLGHLNDVSGTIIYAGKKTEVLVLDSLDANTAQNNNRQILGRIPGMNFSETEGNGFPSNGIGSRGLNPTQSIEMNTRQNGYNITSDVFGYNESYYMPAMDAVERIEFVRGAASLQFGPQFGGTVNFIMKDAPANKPLEFKTQQTYGSFGSFISSNSIGGTYQKLSYYGFAQYKTSQGWRANSDNKAFSGFGKIQYQANSKLKLGLEYSILRNYIHMAGGLTDSAFNLDSKQSLRARNWLNSPWNIFTGTLDYRLSESSLLSIKSTTLLSQRNLVWRNEDGGPGALDTIDNSTGTYVTREVESERFRSSTTEARLLSHYKLLGLHNTIATGIRFFSGTLKRDEGGPGSTGSNFDMNLYGGSWEKSITFGTTNLAYFAENIFRITNKFSVTPGLRFEYIRSTAKGYIIDEDTDSVLAIAKSKNRYLPLFGLGAQYKATSTTTIYGNISQAYRPMDYSSLTPLGVTSIIDPNIKDAYGYSSDIGYRGTVKNYLNFDISLFFLRYNRRIGIVALNDSTTMRTNVANSEHKGIEAYVEFNPVKAFFSRSKLGFLNIFNSFSYVDARYVSANPNLTDENGTLLKIKGNHVEYAPKVINRTGITYAYKGFSITYTISYTSSSYGDATNVVFDPNAVAGIIPAYKVMDISAMIKFKGYNLKAGVNNLANAHYFTKRTDEYPGPGIIPSMTRSGYISIGVKL